MHRDKSPARSHEIDDICDQFEKCCLSDDARRIEDVLVEQSAVNRDSLLRELLMIEFEIQRKRGETPTVADFAGRFPNQAEIVDAALHTVLMRSDATANTADFISSLNAPERTRVPIDPSEMEQTVPGSEIALERQSRAGRKQFGDYELIEEIAAGGMGVVYKARQTKLNRVVALKMIKSGELAGDHEVRRFHAEAEAAAALDHPNIVPIHEVGEQNGQHFFSMGFVEGTSLDAQLKDGPLPPRAAADLIKTIAVAVQYAHDKGIVHRDLKPANVLLADGARPIEPGGVASDHDVSGTIAEADGPSVARADTRPIYSPKITDFGLAKNVADDSGMTATGQILGTPSYMPPEQAAGKIEDVGPLADVYSLGAMLYATLTGRPPFQAANVMETLKQVLERDPISPRQVNPAVDRDLETICLKCLEKDAGKRYATAQHLADELGRFLTHTPILARAVGRIERSRRWCRRNPLGAVVVGLLTLLAIGGPIVAINQTRLSAAARRERVRADEKVVELDETNNQLARSLEAETAAKGLATINERKAQTQEKLARLQLYAAQIKAAQNAWKSRDLTRMLHHLRSSDSKLRGWDFTYLSRLLLENQQTVYGRHGALRTVAVSPADDLLVTGCASGEIRIHNVSTGSLIRQWNAHQTDVLDVALSRDGRQIASVGLDGLLKLWDIESGNNLFIAEKETSSCVSFSFDGNQLIAGNSHGEINIWDTKTHDVLGQWKLSSSRITSIACSSDKRQIVAATAENSLVLWDSIEKKTKSTLKGHTDWVTCVAFSPDGRRIASAGDDETVRIWDIDSTEEIVSLTGHTGPVEAVAFVASGKKLASGASDGTVRIWDVQTGHELQTFVGHLGPVHGLADLPKGQSVISAGADGSIKRWSLTGNQGPLIVKPHSEKVSGIAFDPQGDRLATASWDKSIAILQPSDGQSASSPIEPARVALTCIFFDGEGKTLFAGGSLGGIAAISLSDSTADTVQTALRADGYQAAISADGRKFCSAGHDGFKIWDISTSRLVRQFSQNRFEVTSLVFHPDSETFAAASEDAAISIWNSTTGQRLLTLSGHRGAVNAVSYSPDGKRLFSAGADGTLKVWDAFSGEELLTLRGHNAGVNSVVVSPDGTRVISGGSDSTVRLWHVETGTLLLTLRGRSPLGESLAVHREGRWIASGGGDGTVTIWDGDADTVDKDGSKRRLSRESGWSTDHSLDALIQLIPVADFDFLAAAKRLKQALKAEINATNDQKASHHHDLGLLYSQRGLLARAEFFWRRYRKEAPTSHLGDRRLGSVLLRQGRNTEAREVLDQYHRQILLSLIRNNKNSAIGSRARQMLVRAVDEFPKTLDSQVPDDHPPEGIVFDGESEFCIVPSLYFNGRPPWTIEAVVSPLKPSESWATVVGTVDAGGTTLSMSNKLWRFGMHTARVGFHHYESYSRAFAKQPWELGKTYHLAGVWDGEDLRLYVNGKLQSIKSNVDMCSKLSGFPFLIGADPSVHFVAQGFFPGRIHAVRISRAVVYDKTFQPPNRLPNIAHAIALYEFRKRMQFFVPDLSGNRHHAYFMKNSQKRLKTFHEMARNGQHVEATTLGEKMLKYPIPIRVAYDLACGYAVSTTVVGHDEKLDGESRKRLRARYAALSLSTLKALAKAGLFNVEEYRELLKTDLDLNALRHRKDFHELAKSAGVDLPEWEQGPQEETSSK